VGSASADAAPIPAHAATATTSASPRLAKLMASLYPLAGRSTQNLLISDSGSTDVPNVSLLEACA
jgi:hypothetical protein